MSDSASPIDVSVVIVSFNVRNYLLNCIRSVLAAASRFRVEIIVVDNGSADGSLSSAKKEFPEIVEIQNRQNVGFGTACNQGMAAAKGKVILLLNPDAVIPESLFERLLPAMTSDPEIGLLGCKVLNEDGSLQLACRRSFPTPWIAFTRLTSLSLLFPRSPIFAKYNLTYLDENQKYELDAISGSFMLFSREAYRATGGFDERFFMYGEDLDLCYRVKKAGYKVVYDPSASIIHFKGRSSGAPADTHMHFYRAMKVFVKKHGPNQVALLLLLNLAISAQSILGLLKRRAFNILALVVDYGLTVALMEILARLRYGAWLPFPPLAYPVVYFALLAVQTPIYGWFGVYSARFGVKRRIALAGTVTWLLLSVAAYFTKEFAFSRLIFAGLLVFSPLTHILWRAAVGWLRREPSTRNAALVTTGSGADLSAWCRLKYVLLEGMEIVGFVSQDPEKTRHSGMSRLGDPSELRSLVQRHDISDILIDVDRIRMDFCFELMREMRDLPVRFHRVSDQGTRDAILNEIVQSEERTGILFRMIKRFTDAVLYLELHGRLHAAAERGEQGPSLFTWDRYLVGARTPHKFVHGGFDAFYNIDVLFPGLDSDEDRLTLFLLYNRVHSHSLDQRILKLVLEEKSPLRIPAGGSQAQQRSRAV